jgi:hypothetical protein
MSYPQNSQPTAGVLSENAFEKQGVRGKTGLSIRADQAVLDIISKTKGRMLLNLLILLYIL